MKRNNVSGYIDANKFFNELRILGRLIKDNQPIVRVIDVLNLVSKSYLENLLPNAVIAHRILLTS